MNLTNRNTIRKIRPAFQWSLFLFVCYGGYQLYLFQQHFLSGTPFVERPPMVDGFLPIGALMGLRLWAQTGTIDPVHPAATVILLSALVVSLVFKRSFCAWICPIRPVSELVSNLGQRIFGRSFRLPRALDLALRGLKYLLLGLFLFVILLKMDALSIRLFLDNPYWKLADIRMLMFFMNISSTALIILGVLVILSLFFKNFWCRCLCPYGALLGVVGRLSPIKITRDEETCVGCQKCSKICPNLIAVDQLETINSAECDSCLSCVSVCPVKDTLQVALPPKRSVAPTAYAAMVFALFFAIIWGAQLTGHWHSNTTYDDYKHIILQADKLRQ